MQGSQTQGVCRAFTFGKIEENEFCLQVRLKSKYWIYNPKPDSSVKSSKPLINKHNKNSPSKSFFAEKKGDFLFFIKFKNKIIS